MKFPSAAPFAIKLAWIAVAGTYSVILNAEIIPMRHYILVLCSDDDVVHFWMLITLADFSSRHKCGALWWQVHVIYHSMRACLRALNKQRYSPGAWWRPWWHIWYYRARGHTWRHFHDISASQISLAMREYDARRYGRLAAAHFARRPTFS